MRNEEETGELPASARTIIVNATAISDELIDADDMNWYKFDAVNGETYSIGTANLSDVDTYVFLYSAGIVSELTDVSDWKDNYDMYAAYLGSDDDGGIPDDYSSLLNWTCTADGSYYVLLVDYDYPDGVTGTYDIAVTNGDI